MRKVIPKSKIAATVGGAALTANAVWLNAVHVASSEGWASPLVSAGIAVTLCAAIAPPFAERAAKSGQPLKAGLLWIFFGLAVAFSLSSSIARTSSYATGKVASVEHANEKARLAKEAYEAVKKSVADECVKRGPKCRELESKAEETRKALATAAPVLSTDPGAERVAQVLGVQEASVQLYAPLFLPLGLELGGFIFLAFGMSPRRREDDEIATAISQPEPVATVANPEPAKVSKGGKAYYLQRLEKDYPELATKVKRGEITCHKACVMAGIRKTPAKDWSKPDAYGIKARETA